MRQLRSATEAVTCLLEQLQPGDFVRVQGTEAGFGRVIPENEVPLGLPPLTAGRVFIQTPEGPQEFDEMDLEKVDTLDLPSGAVDQLLGDEDRALEAQFLTPELAEEFGIEPLADRSSRPKDPSKSMSSKIAQRDPLTRQKKRIAMRKNWGRAKSRTGRRLGNEPSALRRSFESMVEQAGAPDSPAEGPIQAPPVTGGVGTKYPGPMTPENARLQTERVYNALSDLMKALTLAEGANYFHSVQDDPDRGTIRLKLNGQTPKDVIERFTASVDSEDMQIELLEQPEGSDEDRDLRGWWIFEAQIPDFEDMSETEIDQEPTVLTSQGEQPGEIRIPIEGEE